MYKVGFFTLFALFTTFVSKAQNPDKEKISELFQNQQFEDAIDYLKPFYLEGFRQSSNTEFPGFRFLHE